MNVEMDGDMKLGAGVLPPDSAAEEAPLVVGPRERLERLLVVHDLGYDDNYDLEAAERELMKLAQTSPEVLLLTLCTRWNGYLVAL